MKRAKGRILRKRALSMLLALTMLFSSIELTAFATEQDSSSETTAVTEETDTSEDSETTDETSQDENLEGTDGSGNQDQSDDVDESTGEEDSDIADDSDEMQDPDGENEEQETPEGNENPEESEEVEDEESEENEDAESEEMENEESELTEDDSATEDKEVSKSSLTSGRVSAYSTNSFGRLFENAINAQAEAQSEEYTGCKLLSIEMSGTQAEVSLQTVSDATLVVGVYEDDGVKLLGTGSTEVMAGETDATVSIDIESMPSNYLLKGYLIETDSLRPLSAVYISEDYTKAMQEFLAKTTKDFAGKPIINLDESINNNFLVLADGVKVIPRNNDDSVNVVIKADEKTFTYVIENADENITGLKEGDTFAYYYADNSLLIAKIASINIENNNENDIEDEIENDIDNKTAIIQGEDIDFNEVFSYVKIGADVEAQYAQDPAGTDSYSVMPYKEPSEYSNTWEPDDPLGDPDDEDGDGISYSIAPSITTELTIFYSDILFGFGSRIEQVRIELLYEAAVDYHVNAKKDKYIDLCRADLATSIPGVVIGADLKLHLAVEGEIGVTGSLNGSVGWQIFGNGTIQDISENPYLETETYIKASASIGFVIAPHIYVLHEEFLSAEISAECGVELEATYSQSVSTNDDAGKEKHGCVDCIDGDVNLFMEISGAITILGETEQENLVDSDDAKVKLGDFYYSIDHNEFGWWKECPYKAYKITVTVKDKNGRKVSGAKVNNEKDTGINGQTWLWLPEGEQVIYATKNGGGYGSVKAKIDGAKGVIVTLGNYAGISISGKVKEIDIALGDNIYSYGGIITEDGSLYMWGDNAYGQLGNGTTVDSAELVKVDFGGLRVKSICLDNGTSAAITRDGSLYMWGQNARGQLGIGNTVKQYIPCRVELENVKSIDIQYGRVAAITESNDLYMWGYNQNGSVGDGTNVDKNIPVKVLENVKEVSLGHYHSGAVTRDGALYMWGDGQSGKLGTGSTIGSYEPTQVKDELENVKVKAVSLGESHSGAITQDGELYMWGSAYYGQVGNDSVTMQKTPQKIDDLNNVESIYLTGNISTAITENGSLYMWGQNYASGVLGNGETENRTVPEKVQGIENAKKFMIHYNASLSSGYCAVITQDGSLYMWGRNASGELGLGTTDSPKFGPAEVLTNVRDIRIHGSSGSNAGYVGATYAVTWDGSLWMWGDDLWGWTTLDGKTSPARIGGASITASVSVLSSVSPEKTVVIPDNVDAAQGTASFTGLIPEETYNFYAMKSKTGEERLSSDNLLYITQAVSDGTGALNIEYQMIEEYENPEIFLVGETRTNISSAEVMVAELHYNGEELYPEVTVVYGGQALTEGVDYLVYGDCVVSDVGEYSITVQGIGCYRGEKTVTFRVQNSDNSGGDDNPGGGDNPDEDTERDDVLPDDIPADGIPEGLWIAGVDENGYFYTGSAIKPEVRVYDHKTLLIEKTDYTITYKNNTKANDASVAGKAPTITVTGKGNYSGKETQTFKILPLDISTVDISQEDADKSDVFEADDISVVYNGKAQKPAPALYWNGKKLTNKTDYTFTYHEGTYTGTDTEQIASVKETGDYYIKLTGKGNFTGTRRLKLTVLPKATEDSSVKPISKATVPKIPNQSYLTLGKNGAVTPEVTVKYGSQTLEPGTHYTVAYSNNTKVGTAYAIITGIEKNGYSGTKRVSFKITGMAISKATVNGLSGQTFVYNGTDIEPVLTLSVKLNGTDVDLVQGTDYSVTWQKNQNAGTAAVTFTGKNGYTGTLKKTFKIKAFNIAENKDGLFKVELMSDTVPYAKGGAKPELTVTFQVKDETSDGTPRIVTLKEGTDYTVSYKNNKAVNDGGNPDKLPTITIKGKGNFIGTYSQNLTYTITAQDLGELKLTAADKVYQNKKNIYTTKVTITDLDGKVLKPGTDYEKKLTYTYKNDTTLDNGTIRQAGDAVDKNDIIPTDTEICVTAASKGSSYIGTLSGEYSFKAYDISGAKVTIPRQTYTGRKITLDKTDEKQILVKVKGKKVESDQFDIVGYTNNVKKGTATVTIKGKGNYGGTKTVKFTIGAKGFLWWWKN